MNKLLKFSVCILLMSFLFSPAFAQTTTKKPATQTTKKKSSSTKKKSTAPVSGKEIPIILKNSCEKKLSVFAGQKTNIKNPKLRIVGGLSKNTLFLKQNDVICIMDDKKKPVSCVVIKPGITYVEIDFAGINISGR